MFQKWLKRLKELVAARQRAEVDPASFGDPIALQTEWTPAAPGGANFATARLVVEGPLRVRFRPTLGARIFALTFIGFGTCVPLLLWMVWYASGGLEGDGEPHLVFVLFATLFGSVFAGLGIYMMRKLNEPIVFDRSRACFHRGPLEGVVAAGNWDAVDEHRQVPLSRIHALQIVSEYIRGQDDPDYYSYELNLVLDGGERVNVVDHGDRKLIRKDAVTLAEFLGVPLWDAS